MMNSEPEVVCAIAQDKTNNISSLCGDISKDRKIRLERIDDGNVSKRASYTDSAKVLSKIPASFDRPKTVRFSPKTSPKPLKRTKTDIKYELSERDFRYIDCLNKKLEQLKIEPLVGPDLLELFLNTAEEFSYFVDRNPPVQPAERWVCSICLFDHSDGDGTLIVCDRCDMAVHVECYGITDIPQGDWKCQKCIHCPCPREPEQLECQLCTRNDSKAALKRIVMVESKDGVDEESQRLGWVHVVCADSFPEIAKSDMSPREPLKGLLNIPKSQIRAKCVVCGIRNDGACTKCAAPQCKTMFHASCAQSRGYEMSFSESTAYSGIEFLCEVHTKDKTKMRSRISDFEQFVVALVDGHERSPLEIVIPDKKINELRRRIRDVYTSSNFDFVFDRLLGYWSLKRHHQDGAVLDRSESQSAKLKRISKSGEEKDRFSLNLFDLLLKKQEAELGELHSIFSLVELKQNALRQCYMDCLNDIEDVIGKTAGNDLLDPIKQKVEAGQYCGIGDFEQEFKEAILISYSYLGDTKKADTLQTIYHSSLEKLADSIRRIEKSLE